MRIVICRLTAYEDLPSPRADEKWCRFHFTAVPKEPLEQGGEQVHAAYRVDVSSNRALKARTLRLAQPDLEKLLYWCGARELARSLGVDPSVKSLRTAIRWGSLRNLDAARVRFPDPVAFEVTLPEPRHSPAPPDRWVPGRG